GFARGTLTANPDLHAEIPEMDPAPVLGHRDMGMDMSGMNHGGHDMGDMTGMGHSGHEMSNADHLDHTNHNSHDMHQTGSMDHSQHMDDHSGHNMSHMHDMNTESHSQPPLAKAGFGSNFGQQTPVAHAKSEYGPHVDSHAEMPQSGLADPGIGLRDHQKLYGRRVLTYADIRGLHPTYDRREPSREIELHLTGNMRRYMWSINGENFADAKPIELTFGERVRFILVNDTMMTHPIHLHGMWSDLETGDPDYIPRKHTIIVQPGSRISYLVTADAEGRWAYHCHL